MKCALFALTSLLLVSGCLASAGGGEFPSSDGGTVRRDAARKDAGAGEVEEEKEEEDGGMEPKGEDASLPGRSDASSGDGAVLDAGTDAPRDSSGGDASVRDASLRDTGAPDARPDVVDTGAPLVCAPDPAASTYVPGPYRAARVQRGSCTLPDIQQFYDDCLGPFSSSFYCNAWEFDPHLSGCMDCLLSNASDVTLGPVVQNAAATLVSLNLAGCYELREASAQTCAEKVQALSGCESRACDAVCPITDSFSFDEYIACTDDAKTGVCQPFAQDAGCAEQLGDAGAASCRVGSSFESLFLNIAPDFCGP